ncbi:hypothetical protein NBRC116494_35250 [Aurantivibrio plasticivorans]
MPELVELPEKNLFSAYGVTLLESKHKTVKKLEKHYQPSIHGHKTWSSSFLLMDYLMHTRLLKQRQRVLELGCGWGPAAIFCAAHADCKVTGLDRDEEVFPFLEVQAALNDVEVSTIKKGFEQVSKPLLKNYDLVFGTDVCFWDELVPMHFKLIKRALDAGVKNIIYTDPGRSTFYELAEKCKVKFNVEYLDWYSTEPDYFEGYILHIKNT